MEEKQRNGAISAHIGHLERTSSDGLWHPGTGAVAATLNGLEVVPRDKHHTIATSEA